MADRLHLSDASHTLRSIARHTYQLSGAGARARETAALAALVRANPHLEEGATVPAGTVLVIPEISGIERNREALDIAAPERDRAADLGRMRDAVAEAGSVLTASYRDRSQAENRSLEVLQKHGPELLKAAPALRSELGEMEAAYRARIESLKSESGASRRQLRELVEGIETLGRALVDRGGR